MLSRPVVRRVDRGSTLCAAPVVSTPCCRALASAVSFKGPRRRLGKSLQSTTSLQQQKTLRCIVHSDLTESAQLNTTRIHEEPESTSPKAVLEQESPSPSPEATTNEPTSPPAGDVSNGSQEQPQGPPTGSTAKPLRVGEEVTISVVNAGSLGATVKLVDHDDQKAFLPYRLFPLTLLDSPPKETQGSFPEMPIQWQSYCKAVVRQVRDESTNRAGNLDVVSVADYNKEILWKRMRQIRDLCQKEHEVVRGHVLDRNKGGLIVSVGGFPCFMPRTCFTKKENDMYHSSPKQFDEVHLFSEVELVIFEVDPAKDKVAVSAFAASAMKSVTELRIGALIEGKITRMEPYGAFIAIGNSQKTGLLHVRNISQRTVFAADEVFKIGETVKAVVLDIDPNYSRISLSTADLEDENGEILWNKERVMKNAPIMAARLQKELEEARLQHFSEMDNDRL